MLIRVPGLLQSLSKYFCDFTERSPLRPQTSWQFAVTMWLLPWLSPYCSLLSLFGWWRCQPLHPEPFCSHSHPQAVCMWKRRGRVLSPAWCYICHLDPKVALLFLCLRQQFHFSSVLTPFSLWSSKRPGREWAPCDNPCSHFSPFSSDALPLATTKALFLLLQPQTGTLHSYQFVYSHRGSPGSAEP